MGITLNEYVDKAMKGIKVEEAESDPGAEYKMRMKQIQKALKDMQAKLKSHETKQKKDPKNWGYAGDLAHVNQALYELLDSMRNY